MTPSKFYDDHDLDLDHDPDHDSDLDLDLDLDHISRSGRISLDRTALSKTTWPITAR